MATLRNIAAPPLPTPPAEYSKQYFEQYNSAMRIFFNTLVNAVNAPRPYGSYYDTTTQTNPVASAANLVTFNTVEGQYNLNANLLRSQIYVAETGWYRVQFSMQVAKTAGAAATVYIWLRKNGQNIAASAHACEINSSTDANMPSADFMVPMHEGDYVQVAWASSDTAVTLTTIAASGAIPQSPCASLTVEWISGL